MPAKRTAADPWKGASLQQPEHDRDEPTLIGDERQGDVSREIVVIFVDRRTEDRRADD
jgi:hypothetical protein